LLGKHLNLLPKICFQTDGGSFGAFDVSQLVFHFVKQVFGIWFLFTVVSIPKDASYVFENLNS